MLQILVDDINDVNEELRSYYIEKNGKYMLDADYSSAGLEDVTNLKSSFGKVKEERNSLREKYNQLKRFEKLTEIEGFDVDSVDELMAKAASANNPEAIERLQREYEKKLAKKEQELMETRTSSEQQSKSLQDLLIKQELTTAAATAGVLSHSVGDVVKLTRSNFSLDESGKVQVLDEDGDPMGITPSEFFSKNYKNEKPHFYAAAQASGSGAPNSTNKGGSNVKSWGEAKSAKEKAEVLKQKIGS